MRSDALVQIKKSLLEKKFCHEFQGFALKFATSNFFPNKFILKYFEHLPEKFLNKKFLDISDS